MRASSNINDLFKRVDQTRLLAGRKKPDGRYRDREVST